MDKPPTFLGPERPGGKAAAKLEQEQNFLKSFLRSRCKIFVVRR